MPISGGQYVAPTWVNNSSPAINASELQAMCDSIVTNQSNISGRAPTSHASSATTYGSGTDTNYGHLKLSASTSSTSGVSGGIAATPSAVKSVNDRLTYGNTDLTAGTSSLTTGVLYFFYE